MKLYEINYAIDGLLNDAVDPETGEILFDPEELDRLQLEREVKLESLALAVKNLTAEAKAIREEETALAERRRSVEKKAERARQYLEFILQGEKFQTAKVAVSYRKSKKLELAPEFLETAKTSYPYLLRFREPEPDKSAITAAIKAGDAIPGAELVESVSMQIK